jgi:hypothetical protein
LGAALDARVLGEGRASCIRLARYVAQGTAVAHSARISSSDTDAGLGCGSITPDKYAFDFAPKSEPAKAVRIYMGETQTADLQPPLALGKARVRNLRSYQTTACDDYWNFAYYLFYVASN